MSTSIGRWLIMVLACTLLPILNGCSDKIVRTQEELNSRDRLFISRAMPPRLRKILKTLDGKLSSCTKQTIYSYAFKQQRAFADKEPNYKAVSWKNELPQALLEKIGLDLREPNPDHQAWERAMKSGMLLPIAQKWLSLSAEPAFESFSTRFGIAASAKNGGLDLLKAYVAEHGLLPTIIGCVGSEQAREDAESTYRFDACMAADQTIADTSRELQRLLDSMESTDWKRSSLPNATKGISELTNLLTVFEEKYNMRLNVCAIQAAQEAKTFNERSSAFELRFSKVGDLSCGRLSESPTLCFDRPARGTLRLAACKDGTAGETEGKGGEERWVKATDTIANKFLKEIGRATDNRFINAMKAIGIANLQYPVPMLDQEADQMCPSLVYVEVQPKFSALGDRSKKMLRTLASSEDDSLGDVLSRMNSLYRDCAYRWDEKSPLSSACRLKSDLDGRLYKQSATRLIRPCEEFLTHYDANHKDIVDHPRCVSANSYLGRKCEKLDSYKANVQGIRDDVAKLKTVLPKLLERQQGLANGHRFDRENRRLLKKCRSAVLALKRKYSPWTKCVEKVFYSRKAKRYRHHDGEMMAETTNAEMHHRILVRAAEKCARQHGITAMVDNGFKQCKSAVQVNQLSMKEALEHSSPFMPKLSSAEVLAISGNREPYFGYDLSGARVPRSFRPGACYQKIYIGSTVLHRIANDFWIKDKVHDVKYVPTPPFFEDP